MRLALTAGGTGGHIFPALSVLEAVREQQGDSLDVHFFGPDNRGERGMVEPRGIAFTAIPSTGIRGRSPLQVLGGGLRLLRGIAMAVRHLRAYRPDVVFSTGGYASFPCSVAARVLRKPLVVYLPDVKPGWAVRAEQRLATRLATTTDAALAYLPAKKTTVTGYPVRPEFFSMSKASAREDLGIAQHARVLLVAGASQGSRSINGVVLAALRALLQRATVIHVTGNAGIDEARAARDALEPALRERYVVDAFRNDLPKAMVAADLAIMRAGASVIGELPAAKLPALLVPGTFAGGHQRDNALWLADQGAAEVIEEAQMDVLGPRAMALLDNDERLRAMADAAGSLARPDAAAAIARMLREVAR